MPRTTRQAGRPTTIRQPRQQRAHYTVEALLQAANELFRAQGTATTTQMIARRAGVAVGSLYQYFPNKDALLSALIEQRLLDGHTSLQTVGDRAEDLDVERLLDLLVARLMTLYEAEAPLLKLLLADNQGVPAALVASLTAVSTIAPIVECTLTRRHDLPADAARTMAILIAQTTDSVCLRHILAPGNQVPAESFRQEVVRMLRSYVRDARPAQPHPQPRQAA